MQIINPATEEIIGEVSEDTEASVREKLALLKAGQPLWAAKAVEERVACIARFYEALDREKTVLAETLTSETGKPLQQSYNELNGARNRIRYFLEHSAQWLAEEWPVAEGTTREKIVYEPLGIIANISAWNYPYLVGVNVFIPALIGGNAVFYKPSEYSTLTGLHIRRLLYNSGIPENAFQIVTGKGKAGEWLLELPLNGYFFTGSYRTGRLIAEKVASKHGQLQNSKQLQARSTLQLSPLKLNMRRPRGLIRHNAQRQSAASRQSQRLRSQGNPTTRGSLSPPRRLLSLRRPESTRQQPNQRTQSTRRILLRSLAPRRPTQGMQRQTRGTNSSRTS